MRALISGICGFAGSYIARDVLESCEKIAIVGLDSLARRGSATNRLEQILEEIAEHATSHPDWLAWCGS